MERPFQIHSGSAGAPPPFARALLVERLTPATEAPAKQAERQVEGDDRNQPGQYYSEEQSLHGYPIFRGVRTEIRGGTGVRGGNGIRGKTGGQVRCAGLSHGAFYGETSASSDVFLEGAASSEPPVIE